MKEMMSKIGKLVIVCVRLGLEATLLLECLGFWYAVFAEPETVEQIITIGRGWCFLLMPIVTIWSSIRTWKLFKVYRRTKLIER